MSGESFECAIAAQRRREPLLATGSQVKAWLLIEVDGAWGPLALRDSKLGEVTAVDFGARLAARGVRAVCIRRFDRRGASETRLFFCLPGLPGRDSRIWQRTVGQLGDVATIGAELTAAQPPPGWEPADPIALICTNGRHDQCCANFGRPVVRAVRESHLADRVWESSHVGGDRFAANVVVLPRSLYFGRCHESSIVRLIDDAFEGTIDLAHFRGRSVYGLSRQAIEHFVRAEFSLTAADDVRVGPVGADGAALVDLVGTAGQRRRLRVVVRRDLVALPEPITCSGSPGQRVPRFELVSIDVVPAAG